LKIKAKHNIIKKDFLKKDTGIKKKEISEGVFFHARLLKTRG